MKNTTISISILLLACSCACKQAEQKSSAELSLLNKPIKISTMSTAYEFPDIQLPIHFYLDSIVVYDSTSRANLTAHYLQSAQPEKKKFNQMVLQFIKNQIATELADLDPYSEDSPALIAYSYMLRPVEIYLDSQRISVYNIIDTYSEGGNHHNYTQRSFNYDLRTNKMIKFDDVFDLRSKIDSVEFIRYAEQFANGCEEWEWPYKHLDFSFADSGIYINPNLSWACASTRSMLPACAANKYLKKSLQLQRQCE